MRSPYGSLNSINAIHQPGLNTLKRRGGSLPDPLGITPRSGRNFSFLTIKPENGMEPIFHRILAGNVGNRMLATMLAMLASLFPKGEKDKTANIPPFSGILAENDNVGRESWQLPTFLGDTHNIATSWI
jgi:hypothetical protein